jgi:tRNA(Ile)-lysidine synthase
VASCRFGLKNGVVTTPLVRALRAALDAPGAPASGSHVLVATSGGPDSTALLAALHGLSDAYGLRVSAGHVRHGLRGAESDGDAAAVASLAASLGIPCVTASAPVAPGGNLEDRARTARRRALRELAREVAADAIALAHTEDDQVETVLLRLLRGAGRGGLGGMWPRRGRLWRPFLGVTRADVRRFLAQEELPFRIDRTNADLRHARNRLRRLVVPLLARETNPRLGPSIAALAARLRDEDALLDALARERASVHRRGDRVAVEVAGEPSALARRIVRAWLDDLGLASTSAREIERILALARGERGGHVGVRGPARIVREQGALVRRIGRRATVPSYHHEVRGACAIDGPEGAWRLSVASRAAGRDEVGGLNARRVRFDADALALPLAVRPVAPGDRIGVPGVGTRKLQDVFVDAKVPRERRGLVPVVADADGAVVWVPGLVRSGTARLTAATTRVLELHFEGKDDDE